MRKLLILLGVAVLMALAASFGWESMPIEERLVRIQAESTLPQFEGVQEQPVEVQAVLLEYADDRVLLLKALAALIEYPELAREILPIFGPEPEFRKILLAHGEAVLPPIHYFLNNEVRSVAVMHYTAQKYQAAKTRLEKYWGADGADENVDDSPDEAQPLSPEQRGWYAVNFIAAEGYDFLGQFVVDDQGNTQWIQTERLTEGVTAFFTGGVRNFETKVQTGEEVSLADAGWVAVDALVVVGAVKFLRMGRAAAASSKSASVTGRTAAYTSRLARVGRIGATIGRYSKWPAVLALGYLVVTHPGIINDVLAGLAEVIGLPILLVQFLGWLLILTPALYLVSWVMRLLIRPSIMLLRGVSRSLAWLNRRRAH